MGSGAITLFRVRGIPVRAHWTLLLILPYLAALFSAQLGSIAQIAQAPAVSGVLSLALGVLLAVALFLSIAVHELAHSLVARRLGARVREITLMLLGGVSLFEKMPRRRMAEALVSGVGPLASLALGGLFLGMGTLFPRATAPHQFLYVLGEANLTLGLFNMVPAFPLDGGRVLRSLLTGPLGAARATRVAVGVGRVGAVALALLGILGGGLLLIAVALFLYVAAGAEGRRERAREALRGKTAREVMAPFPPAIGVTATLADALARMSESQSDELLVVDDQGTPLGIARAEDLRRIPWRATIHLDDVLDGAVRRVARLDADAPAEAALDEAAGAPYVIVFDGAVPAGFIGPAQMVPRPGREHPTGGVPHPSLRP